jgi:hypothetical protein
MRPIGSPGQPVQIETQRPVPLPLQIEPEKAASEPFILTLAGAPPGTIQFGGSRTSSDAWFLPPDSASRLEIVLPEWSPLFEIAIVLRRTDGVVAAQSRAWIAVWPAAPPVKEPAKEGIKDVTGAGTGPDAARDLLVTAGRLLARGDIAGARALYQRGAELGSAPAAMALASTYDPNRLWALGVLGLAGNKEQSPDLVSARRRAGPCRSEAPAQNARVLTPLPGYTRRLCCSDIRPNSVRLPTHTATMAPAIMNASRFWLKNGVVTPANPSSGTKEVAAIAV